jgi:hypothetical protein
MSPKGLEPDDAIALEWWSYAVDYVCMRAGNDVTGEFFARNKNREGFSVQYIMPVPGV